MKKKLLAIFLLVSSLTFSEERILSFEQITLDEKTSSAFFGFGEKETDIGHAGGEVAAAEAAQERQYHHGNVAGVRILNGKTQADSRQQQAGGRDGRPFAAAEYGYHERIEDTQGRPG